MSYVEPFPRYPAFERVVKRDNSFYYIMFIVIIVLVLITAIVVYSIFRNRTFRNIYRCEPGLCVVNLDTGDKRCPTTNDEMLVYDFVFEDCTSKDYCQSAKAPCAVLGNGTLNCDGDCGTGNQQCKCQKSPF